MSSPFINIVVVCNENYQRVLRPGSNNRYIRPLKQLIVFYHSVKKNWTFDHRISVCHSQDFTPKDFDVLNRLDVDFFKVKPDLPGNKNSSYLCRTACYNIKPKIEGTHRLLLDIDMIALKNPHFDFEVDFQAMYAHDVAILNDPLIKYISKTYGMINIPLSKQVKHPYVTYHLGSRDDFYPYFNGGAVLIKEDLCPAVSEILTPAAELCTDKGWKGHPGWEKYKHFGYQIARSLALCTISDNWKPLPRGCNFSAQEIDIKKYGKENISLYHYWGSKGYHVVVKIFPEYFECLQDYFDDDPIVKQAKSFKKK